MSSVLKKLLIAAIVLYVIGTTWMQVRLIKQVGMLEHKMFHLLGGTHEH